MKGLYCPNCNTDQHILKYGKTPVTRPGLCYTTYVIESRKISDPPNGKSTENPQIVSQ